MKPPAFILFAAFWYALVLIRRQLVLEYWQWDLQVYVLVFVLSLADWGLLGLFQWQYGGKDRTLRSYFFKGDSTWIKRFTGVILLFYGAMLGLIWTGRVGQLPPGDFPPGDLVYTIRGGNEGVALLKSIFHYSPLIIQGPISEEFLFRGLLLTFLKQRFDRWIAWALTTMLFVLSHDIFGRDGANLLRHCIILTVAGTILLAVAERAKSLLPAMLLHGLNNLMYAVVEFRRAFPA